ncbi:MAG: hypothetical protein JSV31_29535 [Desulfobacterales bacterium]|nr:MAG: hypothetical protein JSV31_29535 [Desulfobacterales bacterium]
MADWIDPQDIREWSRRLFALRPILLVLLVSAIFILELRIDWIERALGAYLVTTNVARPESGAIWEKGKQTLTARKTLEQIVTDRQASQRIARDATTFNQIAANVSPDQGVMLSDDHFRKLYLSLPREIAQEIISPFELVRLASEGKWRRTYFEKAGAGLMVYLLDLNNRVLQQLKITPSLLIHFEREQFAQVETLEDLPYFENRVYPADRFFDALEAFPEDVRRSMVPNPERLLRISGQIMRVGISDEAVSGFIEIGFEIINGSRRKVIIVQGHEWAVWRLRSHLEEQKSSADIISDTLEN